MPNGRPKFHTRTDAAPVAPYRDARLKRRRATSARKRVKPLTNQSNQLRYHALWTTSVLASLLMIPSQVAPQDTRQVTTGDQPRTLSSLSSQNAGRNTVQIDTAA
jgi:hypothetical protein